MAHRQTSHNRVCVQLAHQNVPPAGFRPASLVTKACSGSSFENHLERSHWKRSFIDKPACSVNAATFLDVRCTDAASLLAVFLRRSSATATVASVRGPRAADANSLDVTRRRTHAGGCALRPGARRATVISEARPGDYSGVGLDKGGRRATRASLSHNATARSAVRYHRA